jgi:hypothetical protein
MMAQISAVANKGKAGKLFLFDSTGILKWSQLTLHNPNSTSLDATGKIRDCS